MMIMVTIFMTIMLATTRSERIDKTLNVEQAEATRDALAKAIYFRWDFTSKVS